jgi:lipopolysaccharide/colanic/teichoic acid biosynthesis glycosyltransferase
MSTPGVQGEFRWSKGERLNRIYLVLGVSVDLLILALSLFGASLIRFGMGFGATLSSLTGTWVFYSIVTLLLSDMESVHYARTSVNRSMHTFRLVRIALIVTIIYVLTVFTFRVPSEYFLHSRLAIAFTFGIWVTLAILVRVILLPWLVTWMVKAKILRIAVTRILACGNREVISSIRTALDTSPFYRILVELVDCEDCCSPNPQDRLEMYRTRMIECRCDDLMIADDELDFDSISRFVIRCHEEGIALSVFSNLFLDIGYYDPWLSFADRPAVVFFTPPMSRAAEMLWRFVDFFIGSMMLIVLSPFLLLLAALIKITSPGPVLFKQKRVGFREKPFLFLKFRSMRHDLAENVKAHKAYFEKYVQGVSADDDGKTYKATDERMVTHLGRLIRRMSIDELPQLMSVVRGDMSLVGPRPCIFYELQYYKDWQRYRFTVKPGLTGIWQVYGRSRLPFDAAQFLDLCYAIKRSIGLNTRLLLKTLPIILSGRGGM